jgi:ribosomal-protein-alanine N-acetyltransferase
MINKASFTNFPNLESKRLVFRQFDSQIDAPLIYELRTNDNVMIYLDSHPHKSIEESQLFIEKNLNCYANNKCLSWVIVDKNTNQSIGDFSFFNINETHSRAEIGYSLLPEYWNKGIMTETLTALIEFGFNTLNLHRQRSVLFFC